jgi:rare lipoprotein A
MPRPRPSRAFAAALAVLGPLLACAPAGAQDTGGAPAAPIPAATAIPLAGASSGTVALSAPGTVVANEATLVSGPARATRRRVRVQHFDAARARWQTVARPRVARDGTFRARWRALAAGPTRLRAVQARGHSPELAVTVVASDVATWYGPGFYGNRTACGQALTEDLLGVAHRTLPCGTPVTLAFKGRMIVVPVIDRGPFTRGIVWDLTAATARALGFTQTERLGATVQPSR